MVNVGASMLIGIKDKPEHVSYSDDYLSTLQMISERHFVFYDITDRRAWLLDGASALLHLLRAFIKHSQRNSRLKNFFIFQNDELEEADEDVEEDWEAGALAWGLITAGGLGTGSAGVFGGKITAR